MYNRLKNESPDDETSTDENKTETNKLTSSLPSADSYGSTSVQDQPVPQFYIPRCALVYYVMAFFGFFCSSLICQGLNVAIVAMVNQTAVITVTNVSEDECPRDPELLREGGEFNWDRNQQGVVLAAFCYGFGVLQVCIKNMCRR